MPYPQALVLEIFKQGELLKVGLSDQFQSAPTLRHYNLISVSFNEVLGLSAKTVSVLNRRPPDPSSRLEQLKSLQKTGKLLWDHLLSRPLKERLKQAPACALALVIDEELIYIPWELVFDGSDFFCLKFSMGRLVRSKGDSSPLQYRQLAERLKMLVLADPTGDLKSAYSEGVNIKNQFGHKKMVHVDFKSTSISREYVKRNICDYDIVHFAGHCESGEGEPSKSGWVLEDGLFMIEDILRMGQGCSMPALVFSNACHSARADIGLIDPGYQKSGYGMASAFLYSGVKHYLGAIRKIEDGSSLVFAREFYACLISGLSVGDSLCSSRNKLVKEFGMSGLHWANYLLYGDPFFIFFKARPRREDKRKSGISYKKHILKIGLAALLVCAGLSLFFMESRIRPGGIYLFLRSQAEYRKGNNLSAAELGEKLLSKDQGFLAVYPIIADSYQRLGDKDKALKYYFDYVLRSERLSNRIHLVQAYIKLGWFYQEQGEYEKSRELYDKALKLSRRINDKTSEAVVLRKSAVWHIDKGAYDQALDLLTKSIAINAERQRNFENAKNLACDYFDVGLVFMNKNDFPAARDFYEKSRRIFEKLDLQNELSDCYFNLGEIYLFEKEYAKALDYYFRGLEMDKKHGNRENIACGYNMIGELYMEIDDLGNAEEYFLKSAGLTEEAGSRMDLANVNYNLGLFYKRQGKKNKARACWRKAQEIYRPVDYEKYKMIREQLLELDNS